VAIRKVILALEGARTAAATSCGSRPTTASGRLAGRQAGLYIGSAKSSPAMNERRLLLIPARWQAGRSSEYEEILPRRRRKVGLLTVRKPRRLSSFVLVFSRIEL
jgi:hypothetical protein